MVFKAKIRKIGNSWGVIIPKVLLFGYRELDNIDLQILNHKGVVTNANSTLSQPQNDPRIDSGSNPQLNSTLRI